MATWSQGRVKRCGATVRRTAMRPAQEPPGWRAPCALRRSQQAGFTLLEVLVAVAVVAIALVTLLHLHARSLDATIQAQDLTTAVLLAQTKMAALGPAPVPGEEQGTYDDPELWKFRWATAVIEHPLNLQGGLPLTVLHLVVTVSWADGHRQRQYTLEGYAAR